MFTEKQPCSACLASLPQRERREEQKKKDFFQNSIEIIQGQLNQDLSEIFELKVQL